MAITAYSEKQPIFILIHNSQPTFIFLSLGIRENTRSVKIKRNIDDLNMGNQAQLLSTLMNRASDNQNNYDLGRRSVVKLTSFTKISKVRLRMTIIRLRKVPLKMADWLYLLYKTYLTPSSYVNSKDFPQGLTTARLQRYTVQEEC